MANMFQSNETERNVALEDSEIIQLVGLKLGSEEYAIDVLKIQEIIRTVEITTVPRTDGYVLGVMNLRGKVIPVIDLRVRFNLDKTDFDKTTRIIVVRFERENIGFVVDEVTEVIRIRKSMVEPTPPLVGSIGQEYILGIVKYDARLIILLDIDRVILEAGEAGESDLRRKFLGNASSADHAPSIAQQIQREMALQRAQEEAEAKAAAQADLDDTDEDADADAAMEAQYADEIAAPAPVAAAAPEADIDLDDLIAMELAKREAETDEMNRKKKQVKPDYHESVTELVDVLSDALSQSDANMVARPAEHVGQDDLDALIAAELAVREAETDELNRRKREEGASHPTNAEEHLRDDLASLIEEELSPHTAASEAVAAMTSVLDDTKEEIVTASNTITIPKDSIDDLKELARKIISGEEKNLTLDVKGEVAELLRTILLLKTRMDDLDPAVVSSRNQLPNVTRSLEDVSEHTEEATFNLMDAADKMSEFYRGFTETVSGMEKSVSNKDARLVKEQLAELSARIAVADQLGFNILHALEFQDITEQKLRKVIKAVEEIGARLGAIVGIIKARSEAQGSAKEFDQGEINQLLVDFGLA